MVGEKIGSGNKFFRQVNFAAVVLVKQVGNDGVARLRQNAAELDAIIPVNRQQSTVKRTVVQRVEAESVAWIRLFGFIAFTPRFDMTRGQ